MIRQHFHINSIKIVVETIKINNQKCTKIIYGDGGLSMVV